MKSIQKRALRFVASAALIGAATLMGPGNLVPAANAWCEAEYHDCDGSGSGSEWNSEEKESGGSQMCTASRRSQVYDDTTGCWYETVVSQQGHCGCTYPQRAVQQYERCAGETKGTRIQNYCADPGPNT